MIVVLFDGIAYGMLLYLMSVGLSVTLGLMNFVNLAHGVFAMFGGYTAWLVMTDLNGGFLVSLVAAFVVAAFLGSLLEILLFRHVYAAQPLDQVLLSIGVVFVAVAAMTFLFGPSVQALHLPAALQGQAIVAGVGIGRYRLFLIGAGLVVSAALWLGVARSRYGAIVRAAVDNRTMTAAMGVNVPRVFFLTFSLGCGLAGLGGALSLELLGMEPAFALKYMVYFLLVVSVGGAGTLAGPFVAALLVGVIDTAGKYYLPQLGGFLIYLFMVGILLWRPDGLLAIARARAPRA